MPELNLDATSASELRGVTARERAAAAKAAKEAGGEKRGPGRPSTASKEREKQAEETVMRSRLQKFFDKWAEQRESRDDTELADAIRDDTDIMARSILVATSPIPVLRKGLFIFLAVAEPMFAFGRIGRILLGRWQNRRAERQAEWERQNNPAYATDGSLPTT